MPDSPAAAHEAVAGPADEQLWIGRFRERLGLSQLIDVHTHFMPERLLASVWAYFDAGGPLIARRWPIAYRYGEARRLAILHRCAGSPGAHRPGRGLAARGLSPQRRAALQPLTRPSLTRPAGAARATRPAAPIVCCL